MLSNKQKLLDYNNELLTKVHSLHYNLHFLILAVEESIDKLPKGKELDKLIFALVQGQDALETYKP